MIPYFRALAWLRWHLVLNSLRPTRKRDTLERASRAFQIAGPILAILLFVPACFLSGIAGLAGGWLLGASDKYLEVAVTALRLLLVFQFILAFLAPLLRAAQGAPPNLSRFLLLPIPSRSLYLGEALGGLGDPWILILASGIVGLSVGWLTAGGIAPGMLVLAGGLAALALLLGLAALSSAITHLVFRDRRRGELVSMILLLLVILGGMMPALFSGPGEGKGGKPGVTVTAPFLAPAAGETKKEEWDGRSLPAWAAVYPPELYVRCVGLAAQRRPAAGVPPLALLAAWAAGVHLIASRLYRRLLETPEIQSARRGGDPSPRWARIPGLTPAASAVAVAQVKLIFRTVQGKIQFCLAPLVIAVFGVTTAREGSGIPGGNLPVPFGILLAFAGVGMAFLTLESSTLNQFAMDRAGLSLEFLAPLSDRDLVRGKAAASALLAASRALPCAFAALIFAPGGSPFLWLAVLAGGAAIFFLLAPGGAIVSALLPKAVDLGRIGRGAKPHPVASFLGMALLLAGAGPAVALSLAAILLLKSPALALLLVAGWAGAAAAISVPLFRVAERLLATRRENLAQVAEGR